MMQNTQTILNKAMYPRPDFIRKDWLSLDGEWEFALPKHLTSSFPYGYIHTPLPQKILVPFSFSSETIGENCSEYLEAVYYARSFHITEQQLSKEILLHFGAVDYSCDVWINSTHVGTHKGGHTQFSLPISSFLHVGKNRVFVAVADDKCCDRPRGKQYWKEVPDRCWYTNTIGIWKSVWLEFTSVHYIERTKLTPDIDRRCVDIELFLNHVGTGKIFVEIKYGDIPQKTIVFSFQNTSYIKENITIAEEDYIDEIHYWSPDSPNLYNVKLTLTDEHSHALDTIYCYFGMRKIETKEGKVFLNNKPIYQRLILDQGYWENHLMTPPSPLSVKQDLELIKAMGFNGARKHQKLEISHYYFWADVLGLLIWCEMPSGYLFNDREIATVLSEWQEIICETYNHPSIITWVPFNESWGIRNVLTDFKQQAFCSTAYFLTKANDSSRLVSTNDGWENPAHTDLFCIHDYTANPDTILNRYKDISNFAKTGMPNRQALVQNATYNGQPFLLTEYGGIALDADAKENNWGYNDSAKSNEDFKNRINALTDAILTLPNCCGYCYTQLTDVMQEVNGLLNINRIPKLSLEEYYNIFSKNPCL